MVVKARLLIGLTGTYGSGKSTVAKIFKSQGATIIDCDKLAHEVFDKRRNAVIYSKLQKLFGTKKLLRSSIAKIVFSNHAKRKKLERIIHPYVRRRILEILSRLSRGIVVIEVPLLFESGFDKLVDYTATVSAPQNAMFARFEKRGIPKSMARRRWKSQLAIQEKARRSDFVIVNSGNLEKLKKQTILLFKKLKQKLSE